MKQYLEENFSTPATSTFASRSKAVGLARGIFFYVPRKGDNAVVRRRPDRAFKELKGIQKLHCVKKLPNREGSSPEAAAVTALTAMVVRRRTAPTKSGWMTGKM